jgi:hypothetical protein
MLIVGLAAGCATMKTGLRDGGALERTFTGPFFQATSSLTDELGSQGHGAQRG